MMMMMKKITQTIGGRIPSRRPVRKIRFVIDDDQNDETSRSTGHGEASPKNDGPWPWHIWFGLGFCSALFLVGVTAAIALPLTRNKEGKKDENSRGDIATNNLSQASPDPSRPASSSSSATYDILVNLETDVSITRTVTGIRDYTVPSSYYFREEEGLQVGDMQQVSEDTTGWAMFVTLVQVFDSYATVRIAEQPAGGYEACEYEQELTVPFSPADGFGQSAEWVNVMTCYVDASDGSLMFRKGRALVTIIEQRDDSSQGEDDGSPSVVNVSLSGRTTAGYYHVWDADYKEIESPWSMHGENMEVGGGFYVTGEYTRDLVHVLEITDDYVAILIYLQSLDNAYDACEYELHMVIPIEHGLGMTEDWRTLEMCSYESEGGTTFSLELEAQVSVMITST